MCVLYLSVVGIMFHKVRRSHLIQSLLKSRVNVWKFLMKNGVMLLLYGCKTACNLSVNNSFCQLSLWASWLISLFPVYKQTVVSFVFCIQVWQLEVMWTQWLWKKKSTKKCKIVDANMGGSRRDYERIMWLNVLTFEYFEGRCEILLPLWIGWCLLRGGSLKWEDLIIPRILEWAQRLCFATYRKPRLRTLSCISAVCRPAFRICGERYNMCYCTGAGFIRGLHLDESSVENLVSGSWA